MKRKAASGRNLMLPELILAIGFFALFSAVCVRIFVSAKQLSEGSAALSSAVLAAESAAESFKAGEEPALYYDELWQPCKPKESTYFVRLHETDDGALRSAHIAVVDPEGDVLYSLTARRFAEVTP